MCYKTKWYIIWILKEYYASNLKCSTNYNIYLKTITEEIPMDKRSRTYDLDGIKEAFNKVCDLRMTRTARQTIVELGLTLENVIFIVQSLSSKNFYKSMTTYADHKVWQDVYHFQYNSLNLYIKFMIDDEAHLIVSFKKRSL